MVRSRAGNRIVASQGATHHANHDSAVRALATAKLTDATLAVIVASCWSGWSRHRLRRHHGVAAGLVPRSPLGYRHWSRMLVLLVRRRSRQILIPLGFNRLAG